MSELSFFPIHASAATRLIFSVLLYRFSGAGKAEEAAFQRSSTYFHGQEVLEVRINQSSSKPRKQTYFGQSRKSLQKD